MPIKPLFLFIAWLLILLASIVTISSKLVTVSDISAFLPTARNSQQELLLRQVSDGAAGRLLIVAIEGGEQEKLVNLNQRFASDLRELDFVVRVENGISNDVSEWQQWVRPYRYLLAGDFSVNHNVANLRAAFEARLFEIRSAMSPLSAAEIARDPTLQSFQVMQSWKPESQPLSADGVWIDKGNTRTLMMVEIAAGGYDADKQTNIVKDIRKLFSTYEASDVVIHISGPATFAADSKTIVTQDVKRYSVIASVVLFVLLTVAYRSIVPAILAGLPLLTSVLVAIASCALIFKEVHGITLAFGITLLGVTLDYPIHFFSHLRSNSATHALRTVWPTMRVGLLTTLLGYIAFTFTEFEGLTQLAIFSIIGLTAGALTTRFLLPALPESLLSLQASHSWIKVFQPPGFIKNVGIVISLAIVVIAILDDQSWLENKLTAISVVPESSLRLDQSLRRDLLVPDASQLLVVRGQDPQQVLQKQEELHATLRGWRQSGVVEGYDLASKYLPSIHLQKQRQLQLPTEAEAEDLVDAAIEGLPLRSSAFAPFVRELGEAKDGAVLDFSTAIKGPLQPRLENLLFQYRDQWVGIITLSNVNATADIGDLLIALKLPGVEYVNLSQISAGMLSNYVQATAIQLIWVAVVIIFVLMLALRDYKRVSKIVAIGVFALVIDVMILHLSGQKLSVFHLVALLLVLGIGLDYALFFTRPGFDGDTLHSLLVCCASTVMVFGLLACSNIPVIHAIGSTVALGVLLCFVYGAVFSRTKTQ